MPVRPRLKTHVGLLRRGPGAVQFGITPDLGVVLEGLCAAEITLLERLDGSADLSGLRSAARSLGIAETRLEELLRTLSRNRLLVEEPTNRALLSMLKATGAARLDLASDADALAMCDDDGGGDGYGQISMRGAHHVLVSGHGSLPDTIAALLLRAGVGTVTRDRSRADDGRADLPRSVSPAAPDVVVLAGAHAMPVDAGEHWQSVGIVHLPVISLGHRVVIGPLIRPGAGPCLRCLDLHRSDRDAAWPMVLAQLVSTAPGRPSRPVHAETAVATVAAGLVAMVVHARIAGRDLPLGASMEVALPWPRIEHREWTAHPRCPCSAPGAVPGPAPGPGQVAGPGHRNLATTPTGQLAPRRE